MDLGVSLQLPLVKIRNFKTGNFGKVRLVDDGALDITNKGDINLWTTLSTSWTLKDF